MCSGCIVKRLPRRPRQALHACADFSGSLHRARDSELPHRPATNGQNLPADRSRETLPVHASPTCAGTRLATAASMNNTHDDDDPTHQLQLDPDLEQTRRDMLAQLEAGAIRYDDLGRHWRAWVDRRGRTGSASSLGCHAVHSPRG